MTGLTISRQAMYRNDEDYTNSVCLLLPKGHATLIDVDLFDYVAQFDWKVLGRTVYIVERSTVTYVRRRCGIGRSGYGNFRIAGKTRMHSLHRTLFLHAIKDSNERHNAGLRMYRKHIDHENQNPWDNRAANLRIATPSQNAHNRPRA